jgi:hypothetical protein
VTKQHKLAQFAWNRPCFCSQELWMHWQMFSKILEKIMTANKFGKWALHYLENPQTFYVKEQNCIKIWELTGVTYYTTNSIHQVSSVSSNLSSQNEWSNWKDLGLSFHQKSGHGT